VRVVKIMLATIAAAVTLGVLAGPAAALVNVYVWATNVNLRYSRVTGACTDFPSVFNCETVLKKVSREWVAVYCQKRGQRITDSGYSSEWWSYKASISGYEPTTWINNVYIRGAAHLDGVPDCTF
jgi:hypothetical protein